ncbi:MAG: rhomboid family intramembrane serine protease [Acidobacteria bacterium]|nr:rhomboid family intramembrane serine protease [Acidobacteriota bacterium]MCL5288206.1 rhomboid family intramembrane serine protease [Acidobacteriota bacterium]
MGMESRRYGYQRINWGGVLTPAVKGLLIANTAVFIVQSLVPDNLYMPIIRWLGLVPYGVTHGLRLWQPFTYLFLHGGFWHLFWNMLALWMFGCDLERVWGKRKFLNYYFLTGVGAGCINILVKTIADPSGVASSLIPTIGASGAIFGILIAAAVLFPDRRIYMILPPVELPMRVYVFIMGAIAFFGTMGASGDKVSHVSHLGGMLVGYLYLRRGSFFFSVRNRMSDWKRRRMKKRFEVYMHDHKNEPPSRPDRWVN